MNIIASISLMEKQTVDDGLTLSEVLGITVSKLTVFNFPELVDGLWDDFWNCESFRGLIGICM